MGHTNPIDRPPVAELLGRIVLKKAQQAIDATWRLLEPRDAGERLALEAFEAGYKKSGYRDMLSPREYREMLEPDALVARWEKQLGIRQGSLTKIGDSFARAIAGSDGCAARPGTCANGPAPRETASCPVAGDGAKSRRLLQREAWASHPSPRRRCGTTT